MLYVAIWYVSIRPVVMRVKKELQSQKLAVRVGVVHSKLPPTSTDHKTQAPTIRINQTPYMLYSKVFSIFSTNKRTSPGLTDSTYLTRCMYTNTNSLLNPPRFTPMLIGSSPEWIFSTSL